MISSFRVPRWPVSVVITGVMVLSCVYGSDQTDLTKSQQQLASNSGPVMKADALEGILRETAQTRQGENSAIQTDQIELGAKDSLGKEENNIHRREAIHTNDDDSSSEKVKRSIHGDINSDVSGPSLPDDAIVAIDDILFLLHNAENKNDDAFNDNGDENEKTGDDSAIFSSDNNKRVAPVRKVQYRRAFSSWGGKRSDVGVLERQLDFYGLDHPSEYEKRAAFSAWAGKRSDDDNWKRAAFSAWAGKRSNFQPQFGDLIKRAVYSAWAGKRSNLAGHFQDVMKRAGFSAWAGKRSDAEFDDDLADDSWPQKRAAFSAWAGKRVVKRAAFSARAGKSAEGTADSRQNINTKQNGDVDTELFTDTKNEYEKRAAFSAWAGKRSSDAATEETDKRAAFNAWAGKRTPFSAWAGKRASFSAWDEKRAPFSAWAGKRAPFSAWAGKRAPFSAWAGKRAPFSAWAGKRSDESVVKTLPGNDNGNSNCANDHDSDKRPAFSAWSGKRSEDVNLHHNHVTNNLRDVIDFAGVIEDDASNVNDFTKRSADFAPVYFTSQRDSDFDEEGSSADYAQLRVPSKRLWYGHAGLSYFERWLRQRMNVMPVLGKYLLPKSQFAPKKRRFNSWGGKRSVPL